MSGLQCYISCLDLGNRIKFAFANVIELKCDKIKKRFLIITAKINLMKHQIIHFLRKVDIIS